MSDLIIRIKNAAMARRREVVIPYSKMNKSVLSVLQKEGFLDSVKEEGDKTKKNLLAVIRYVERMPIITDCEIISRSSLRKYEGAKVLKNNKKRGGVTVVSTSKG